MNALKSGKLILTSYKREHTKNKSDSYKLACFIADNRLEYLKVLPDDNVLPVGSIVTGKVKNIVPNIHAAFVALDDEQHMGFLSMNQLEHVIVTNRNFQGTLRQGDEILVQITREPIKTKEAAITTSINLNGKYFVVQPGSGRLLFSKKLSPRAKELLLQYLCGKAFVTKDKQLIGMDDLDITVRTEAANLCIFPKSNEQNANTNAYVIHGKLLSEELTELTAAYRNMISKASMRPCYTVHVKPVHWLDEIQKELTSCGFKIEEYVSDDINIITSLKELLTSDAPNTEKIHKPEINNIRFYNDTCFPLSVLYGINSKIDELLHKNVWLPSGGYLCIEPTEAMVVIDVNSGKSIRKGTNDEELFLTINKEAATEILRQLRLRNLSGMVLVDFINMKNPENEAFIRDLVTTYAKQDFARINVYEFTKLGLLEMTREKKRKAIHEVF